ncbi:hypothetical protein VTL71DRAFT_12532 [Oculimacula yallundae]|uniref:Heterokaryon incompatibility domain-containing protein n=1 Tax=Oculimacula yallundae TaxID=86028 RepID=A0ABR4CP27_9HELO
MPSTYLDQTQTIAYYQCSTSLRHTDTLINCLPLQVFPKEEEGRQIPMIVAMSSSRVCEKCASIDPSAIQERCSSDEENYPEVDCILQNSARMFASAKDGCQGCQFFLDVINRECNSSDVMEAFVKRAESISIIPKYRLYTELKQDMPSYVYIGLDLCDSAAELDFANTLAGAFRPIPKDPSSKLCLDVASAWLKKCSSHPECAHQDAVPLPSRLIELAEDPNSHPRLKVTSGEFGHYLTLSHCWGSGVKFVTLRSHFEDLRNAITSSDLSQSFQDAITITRKLGFRYLWIDALCIIQDSVEDWSRESSQMANIYKNGVLMLSALAASDGQQGMLRPRNILRSHRFCKKGNFVWQTKSEWTSFQNNSPKPLDERAWAYQERIMAPRILHFGEQKLLWECASAQWAEDTVFVEASWSMRQEKQQVERFVRHAEVSSPTTAIMQERLQAYYNCIQEYKRRQLTRGTDILPAFSGLASAFRIPEFGAYLAGLWEADLVYGLAWKSEDPEDQIQDDRPYIAPSWSWASAPGRCSINRIREWLADTRNWAEEYKSWTERYAPRLTSYTYNILTSDPHGMISSSSIVLHGYWRPLLLQTAEKNFSGDQCFNQAHLDRGIRRGYPWKFGLPNEFEDWFVKWLDVGNDNVRQLTALQIGMASQGTGSPMALVMLLLDNVEGSSDTYRRVGILESRVPDDQMTSDKWEIREFRII